jgi:hypothetical protein
VTAAATPSSARRSQTRSSAERRQVVLIRLRRHEERSLSTEELTRTPETYRPDPEALFARSEITALDMPKFSTVTNRIEVIFDGAEPSTEAR